MKIKSMLAYTTLIVSVGFLGVAGIDNNQKDLNRISAKVLEGDISVLGENEYYYDNFMGLNDLLLTINNKGIATRKDVEERYYTHNIGNTENLRFSDSYINKNENEKFFKALNSDNRTDLYILKNDLAAIAKQDYQGREKVALEIIVDDKGNVEEEVLDIPYQDLKIKNIRGIAGFSVVTVGENDNKLQIILNVAGIHSDSTEDYKYNHQYTDVENKNIYIEYDLDKKSYIVEPLDDIYIGFNKTIIGDSLYASHGDTVLEYNLKDLKKKSKTHDLRVYDENIKYKWSCSGFSEISNVFYSICILQDGSIDLKYLEVETKEVSTYKDLKVFDVKELETQGENHIENPFTVAQVFIDNGKLFINYNYKSYSFDVKSYMKVIDLKSGKIELLLETVSNDEAKYDKMIK
ncbi:hypothetical protein [uncultured Clostridium sp.]|uniref:hypothetical protein n=1 Tax=uncultured Clostridium sp. TaxID=59620 RepID=UPI00262F2766|nr:hypothetical protein [uncultured Clostridium sp.]